MTIATGQDLELMDWVLATTDRLPRERARVISFILRRETAREFQSLGERRWPGLRAGRVATSCHRLSVNFLVTAPVWFALTAQSLYVRASNERVSGSCQGCVFYRFVLKTRVDPHVCAFWEQFQEGQTLFLLIEGVATAESDAIEEVGVAPVLACDELWI